MHGISCAAPNGAALGEEKQTLTKDEARRIEAHYASYGETA
jgi:hypothetical protein